MRQDLWTASSTCHNNELRNSILFANAEVSVVTAVATASSATFAATFSSQQSHRQANNDSAAGNGNPRLSSVASYRRIPSRPSVDLARKRGEILQALASPSPPLQHAHGWPDSNSCFSHIPGACQGLFALSPKGRDQSARNRSNLRRCCGEMANTKSPFLACTPGFSQAADIARVSGFSADDITQDQTTMDGSHSSRPSIPFAPFRP